MNTSVAIALLTKLKLIFETDANGNKQDDKFLSFQNGSFPVSKENFYFMEPDKYNLSPLQTALKMVDFSKSFNFVSAVDDFVHPTSADLEQVYYDVLKNAITPNSSRTADEEQRYAVARDFLSELVETDTGGQKASVLDVYYFYEDIYKEAASNYKNMELAVKNAVGEGAEEIQAQWQEQREILQRAISSALLNWETKGKRAQVERYLGEFTSLSGSSPSKLVSDLKMEYELFSHAHAVDNLGNELRYLPTQFSPVNFFDKDVSWQSLSLEKTEVKSLFDQAPERLKNLFQVDSGNIDISKISFEYIVVDIVREWFHYKDFMLQNYWKLANDEKLSDGKMQGRLPAFPQKMIFVRNIQVEAPAGSPLAKEKPQLTFQLFQKLKPSVNVMLSKNIQTLEDRKPKEEAIKRVLSIDNSFFINKQVKAVVAPRRTVQKMAVLQGPVLLANQVTSLKQPLIKQPSPITKPPLLKVNTTVKEPVKQMIFNQPLKPVLANRRVLTSIPVKTEQPKTGASVSVTEYKDMELLAFICSKVPVCPYPNPDLPWDE